jgi:hypothetical protein
MDRKKPVIEFRTSLRGLPYDQAVADRPPIPVTTSNTPTPAAFPEQVRANPFPHPTYVNSGSTLWPEKDLRRDSGLAGSSARNSRTTVSTEPNSVSSLKSAQSLPQLRPKDGSASVSPSPPPARTDDLPWLSLKRTKSSKHQIPSQSGSFHGIALDIPTSDLHIDLQPEKMDFSKRGSMLLGGGRHRDRKVPLTHDHRQLRPAGGRASLQTFRRWRHSPRILSTDEQSLSQKVRSYYENGNSSDHELEPQSSGQQLGPLHPGGSHSASGNVSVYNSSSAVKDDASSTVQSSTLQPKRAAGGDGHELAGGIEDWKDIEGGEVDRYGFIIPRSSTRGPVQSGSSNRPISARDQRKLQRVSTSLQLAADSPRRKHTIRRAASSSHSTRPAESAPGASTKPTSLVKNTDRLARPSSPHASLRENSAASNSRLRQMTNRLPHNRDRRTVDEAGDMLTLSSGLVVIEETGEVDTNDRRVRDKEMERMDKWHKMAKIVSVRPDGGGTQFDLTPSWQNARGRVFPTDGGRLPGMPSSLRARGRAKRAYLTRS